MLEARQTLWPKACRIPFSDAGKLFELNLSANLALCAYHCGNYQEAIDWIDHCRDIAPKMAQPIKERLMEIYGLSHFRKPAHSVTDMSARAVAAAQAFNYRHNEMGEEGKNKGSGSRRTSATGPVMLGRQITESVAEQVSEQARKVARRRSDAAARMTLKMQEEALARKLKEMEENDEESIVDVESEDSDDGAPVRPSGPWIQAHKGATLTDYAVEDLIRRL